MEPEEHRIHPYYFRSNEYIQQKSKKQVGKKVTLQPSKLYTVLDLVTN